MSVQVCGSHRSDPGPGSSPVQPHQPAGPWPRTQAAELLPEQPLPPALPTPSSGGSQDGVAKPSSLL